MIKKIGSYYIIFSKTGKKLGQYRSLKNAMKRLQQIEYFKRKRA